MAGSLPDLHSSMTPTPSAKFQGIEAGRGAAALFVVLAHATTIIAEPRFDGAMPFGGFFQPFGTGIDFFFVLSGFIIAWVHGSDIGRPERFRNYAYRRFFRIYPAYWAVLFPLVLLYFLLPGTGIPSQRDPLNLLFSAALLPYPAAPVLGVAWTLVHEIFFYLLFSLLILCGRRLLWLIPVWIGLILFTELSFAEKPFPFSIFFNAFNLEFIIGGLAAVALRRWRIPSPRVLAIVGFCAFCLLTATQPAFLQVSLLARLAYGCSVFLGIVGVVEWERSGGLKVNRALTLLGTSSYAIYLVHGVALSIVIQIAFRLIGPALKPELMFGALIVIAVAAGIAFHYMVEKPLARLTSGSATAARKVNTTPAGT
jgi:peptidoglycan/LPS O-acetylase OafA/YrhL